MELTGYRDDNSIMSRRRSRVLETAFTLFTRGTIESVNMTDIADASEMGVASIYRYFGTKANLVIELTTRKWYEYLLRQEERYAALGGGRMTGLEELEFFLGSLTGLYEHHRALLCFNANFDQYIRHEDVDEADMEPYYRCMGLLRSMFSRIYTKGRQDNSIRTDIPEAELFSAILYTVLGTAQKFATGTAITRSSTEADPIQVLRMQKQLILRQLSPPETTG